jgi:methylmalonyl-CoA mutase N-terminal domain/subunit
LSTAFDMPSLMGHDSDSARSLGEVGREGVAIDTLDDMQTLFDAIDMGEVSTSMTINPPALDRLAGARARRDGEAVERTLVALKESAARDENLMEPLLECARAHASEGEIVEALQGVFGTYTESPVF